MQEKINKNKALWLLRSVRADWEQSFSVLQTGFDLLQRRLPQEDTSTTTELLAGMRDTLLQLEQMTACLTELSECQMEERAAEMNPVDGADLLTRFAEAFRKLSFQREWPLAIELSLSEKPICLLGNAVYLDMLLSGLISSLLQLGGVEQAIQLELTEAGNILLHSSTACIPEAMQRALQEENYGELLQNRALYGICMAQLYSSAMQWELLPPTPETLQIKTVCHDKTAPLHLHSPLTAQLEQERIERMLARELDAAFGKA